MSTFVLWDLDGTLIRNSPNTGELYLDAVEHVTGVRPDGDAPDRDGSTDAEIVLELLRGSGQDEARLSEVLFDLDVLTREQHERNWDREQCAGAAAALEAVAERGWVNALLTGNGPDRARYKLLAAGFDPELFDWEHSYFGHESPNRHHGDRETLETHTVIVVGDAPNDARAAEAARLPFVGVATGMYPADTLQASTAIVVLEDLESGLQDLLAAVDTESERVAESPEPASVPFFQAEAVPPFVADDEPSDAAEVPDAAEPSDAGEAESARDKPEAAAESEPADDEPAHSESAESESTDEAADTSQHDPSAPDTDDEPATGGSWSIGESAPEPLEGPDVETPQGDEGDRGSQTPPPVHDPIVGDDRDGDEPVIEPLEGPDIETPTGDGSQHDAFEQLGLNETEPEPGRHDEQSAPHDPDRHDEQRADSGEVDAVQR